MSNIDSYAQKWKIDLEGAAFVSKSSILQPCYYRGIKSILKIALIEEEVRGAKLMQWWGGKYSARVLEIDNEAVLLEYLDSGEGGSLKSLVEHGEDDRATRIICSTAKALHNIPQLNLPPLVLLSDWFSALIGSNSLSDDVLIASAQIADVLLKNQQECCVLHGDLHHENIMYSADAKIWKVIDPKGLYGDRAFDFANILCNPSSAIAVEDGRLLRQLNVIYNETGIDVQRMRNWVIAWCGLSAIWMQEDGLDAYLPLAICKQALNLKV